MINIHNMMEELVIDRINVLYDQVKSSGSTWLTCDCENCRLDTVSYVLNRVPPRYAVSGRGVTYNTKIMNDTQLTADIDKLGIEGMRLVSSAKRPYHKTGRAVPTTDTPIISTVYNFPTFIGNVFDGSSFEPLTDATITLIQDDKLAEMMDVTWPNPSKTFSATQGNYTFWVVPTPAERENEEKIFQFTVNVTAPNYNPVTYTFELPITSESFDRREFNSTFSYKIKDLFLFRTDIENEMEWNGACID